MTNRRILVETVALHAPSRGEQAGEAGAKRDARPGSGHVARKTVGGDAISLTHMHNGGAAEHALANGLELTQHRNAPLSVRPAHTPCPKSKHEWFPPHRMHETRPPRVS